MTVPGVGPVLAYTIAAEIGDIGRFAGPKRLAGYTGLCPRVYGSGPTDRRGSLAKTGPKYLRRALIEAATTTARNPRYHDRCQRTKRRLGAQRGSKVARVELARELAGAIWYMLTRQEPFRAVGPRCGLVAWPTQLPAAWMLLGDTRPAGPWQSPPPTKPARRLKRDVGNWVFKLRLSRCTRKERPVHEAADRGGSDLGEIAEESANLVSAMMAN